MDLLLPAVVGVVVIAAATALAPRVGIAGPLALVLIGLGVSLLPFVHVEPIDPEIILVGVLPPLLYSAAVSIPAVEFRRDFTPIAGLSVLLVLGSALVLGLFFSAVIPGLGLPLAIALGAILSPTDAVATSIVKRLGISPRVVTMLDGESLLNDATSLVMLRTAVAAVAGGFSLVDAVGSFAWGVLVAIVVGVLIGVINLRVRMWLSHSAASTALSFVVPFAAYLPTEQLGGSGLVAAVVAGIVTGQGAAKWFTPEERLSGDMSWRTIELVLEGAVFLIMGLELKELVRANVEDSRGIGHALWLAAVALAIVLATRALYVTALVLAQRWRARGRPRAGGRRRGRPIAGAPRQGLRARVRRAVAELEYYRRDPLTWRHGTVLVWAGMRGVVTLAAAQTLPRETAERPLLVFVAFLVAVGSLMLQGFTLPLVVRAVGLAGGPDPGPGRDEERRLDARLRDAAASALPTITRRDGTGFDQDLIRTLGARLTVPPDDDMSARTRDIMELRLALIGVMRERLDELSRGGEFSTAALRHTLAELDADQISLQLRLGEE